MKTERMVCIQSIEKASHQVSGMSRSATNLKKSYVVYKPKMLNIHPWPHLSAVSETLLLTIDRDRLKLLQHGQLSQSLRDGTPKYSAVPPVPILGRVRTELRSLLLACGVRILPLLLLLLAASCRLQLLARRGQPRGRALLGHPGLASLSAMDQSQCSIHKTRPPNFQVDIQSTAGSDSRGK